MDHQDWTPVVFRKRPPVGGPTKDAVALRQAQRAGNTESRVRTGNREASDRVRKMEAAEEMGKSIPVNRLSVAQRQEMVRARTEKKLSQVQLAQQMNLQPGVVGDLEAGRPVQDAGVLAKINRALGTRLRFE